MGRPCPKVKPGYRRVEYGRHVLFYRAEADGVFIVRVLHGRMLPGKQAMEGGGGGL
jgi:toxin ParE1/3/4